MPAYSQWSMADRKKLVEDVVKATSRGELPDGSKPDHLVSASGSNLKKLSDLLRIGDVPGGEGDTHDYSSVEGVGRDVDEANKKLDLLLDRLVYTKEP